jgi:hypothetical protein
VLINPMNDDQNDNQFDASPSVTGLTPTVGPGIATGFGDLVVARSDDSLFRPYSDVTRLDFAVGLVRGAGLQAEAEARAGESLALADGGRIPSRLRGYVAVALERGLIDIVGNDGAARFNPRVGVPRVDAARFLLRLLELK